MKKESLFDVAEIYFKRFGFKPAFIKNALHPDTKLIIVIPCYDEPDLLITLCSLANCQVPLYPVEVIIVINAGKGAGKQVTQNNLHTLRQAQGWLSENQALPFRCHLLYVDDLPVKHAGVGLARKIGMDEALRRFVAINYSGLIVCLDADCVVSKNYLVSIENQFLLHLPHVCNIYFEHDLTKVHDENLRQGIIHYELFLRYYINALKYSGFPFAMHTIGSSMAVRADIYAKAGGMNRRKAGEDFYFLHKVAPQRNFIQINEAVVYPASRISYRVPFGTGRAQSDWQKDPSKFRETYHLQTFEDLKVFLLQIDTLYQANTEQAMKRVHLMPDAMQAFLMQQNFADRLSEIQQHTAGVASFKKRFFQWFDGFRVLKYVHFARDHFYPQMSLPEAASKLLIKFERESKTDTEDLLKAYRALDRQVSKLF